MLLVALAALAALVLSACGGGDSSSSESSSSSEEGSTSAAETTTSSTSEPKEVEFTSKESGLPTGYPEPEPAQRKLAFLTVVGTNEFMKAVGEAMNAEAEQLGGSVTVFDAKEDVNNQVTEFQQALAQGYEGFFVNAADNQALAPLLKQAEEKGVPVIGLDTSASATDLEGFTSQVWEQREKQAYLQVQELAGYVEPGAPIGQIEFGIPIPVVKVYSEYERKWAPKFGLEIVGTVQTKNDGITGGQEAMTGLLAKYPEIQGVLPYNDPNGIGASSAARAQGKPEFPIVGTNGGTDALAAIKAGNLTATVKIDAVSIGSFATQGLYDAIAGEKIDPTVLSGEPVVVNKENVDETESWQEEIAAISGS